MMSRNRKGDIIFAKTTGEDSKSSSAHASSNLRNLQGTSKGKSSDVTFLPRLPVVPTMGDESQIREQSSDLALSSSSSSSAEEAGDSLIMPRIEELITAIELGHLGIPSSSQELSLGMVSSPNQELPLDIASALSEQLTLDIASAHSLESSKKSTVPAAKKAHNLPVSIDKFIAMRRPHLRKFLADLTKVKDFMDEITLLRHEFRPCHHSVPNLCTDAPIEWCELVRFWDFARENIRRMILNTKLMIQRSMERESFTKDQFQGYFEALIIVCDSVDELRDVCDDGLSKYRRFCLSYDNYLFVIHIAGIHVYLEPLCEKFLLELRKFTEFSGGIEAILDEAKPKCENA